jgi:hypothetical protein
MTRPSRSRSSILFMASLHVYQLHIIQSYEQLTIRHSHHVHVDDEHYFPAPTTSIILLFPIHKALTLQQLHQIC